MKTDRGLTLIEFLVVFTIIAILASFSLGGMSTLVTKKRVKSVAQKLSSEINFARFLARKTGKRVWLVTSKGEAQVWPDLGERLLYFIFVDENWNNIYDINDTIVVKEDNTSIKFENNNLGKNCYSSTAKCLIFFPVGIPLIGNQSRHLDIRYKNTDICYRINVFKHIGIAEISSCE